MKYDILKNKQPKKLATSDKRLVVEGYPRSGNSFFSDFIKVAHPKTVRFAHHTHLPENVLLALDNNVPAVVLIRNPLDSISSFMIYSGHDVKRATNQWIKFYNTLLKHIDHFAVVTFEQAVNQPKAVFEALNRELPLKLVVPEDEATAIEAAKNRIVERTEDMAARENAANRKDPVLTACLPNEGRNELKKTIAQEVEAYLKRRPRVAELYEAYTNAAINLS